MRIWAMDQPMELIWSSLLALSSPWFFSNFKVIIEDFKFKLCASLQRGDWLLWVPMYRTRGGKCSYIPDTTVVSLRGDRGNSLLFWMFRLTNVHKIDIFQSGIHRVAAQIFLHFQGKRVGVRGKLSWNIGKVNPSTPRREDSGLLRVDPERGFSTPP